MLIDLSEYEVINKSLPKAEGKITRKQAKEALKKHYPDLPPNGHWVTIKGHHVYIVDGKVVAGFLPWVSKKGETKVKKMAKKRLKLAQEHIDKKEAKKAAKEGKTSEAAAKQKKTTKKTATKKTTTKHTEQPQRRRRKASEDAKKTALTGLAAGIRALAKQKEEAEKKNKLTKETLRKFAEQYPDHVVHDDPFGNWHVLDQNRAVYTSRAGFVEAGVTKENGQLRWMTEKEKREARDLFKQMEKTKMHHSEMKPSEELPIFHGTKLAKAEAILKEGFRVMRQAAGDFGVCAYFKSPVYDHREETFDQASSWLVNSFTGVGKEPAVIEARIPTKEVLEIKEGNEPEELKDLLAVWKHGRGILGKNDGMDRKESYHQYVYAYLTGKDPMKYSDLPVFKSNRELWMALAKEDFPGKDHVLRALDSISSFDKLSPYQVYCAKHGYKAVVSVLPTYRYEGWQIGVYDPSIIKIKGIGKTLEGYGKFAKLRKSLEKLLKSLQKAQEMPYTLLHLEKKGKHYHLYVGAYTDRVDKSVKLYIAL